MVRPRGYDHVLIALTCAASLVLLAPTAGAQVTTQTRASNLAINGAIGGVVAGLRSLFTGNRGWRVVLAGAGGGVVQGVGKQLAASRFSGAGLLGREVSAAGVSLTYSATVDTTVIFAPIGPVMLEIRPRSARHVRARVSAVDIATIAAAAIDGHSNFDLGLTLSAGAPVFLRPSSRMPMGYADGGFTQVGTIFLANEAGDESRRQVLLPHESVHILQWDAYSQLAALPIERRIAQHIPGIRWVERYIDLGVVAPASVYAIAQQIPYEDQPWEREAYLLTVGKTPKRLHPILVNQDPVKVSLY